MAFWDLNATTAAVEFLDQSTDVTTTEEPRTKISRFFLINRRLYLELAKGLVSVQFVLSLGGLVGNVLSIRTFLRLGLKDCVTITFYNLAISDLFLLVANNLYVILYLKNAYLYSETFFGFNPFDLMDLIETASHIFIYTSAYFLAFLAVQRSLCVVRPLQFKNMFTRPCTFVIVAFIWGYWTISRLAWWVGIVRFRRNEYDIIYVEYLNTFFSLCFSHYDTIMNSTILPFVCVVINLAGLFVMAVALIKSVRFRQTTSNAGVQPAKSSKGGSAAMDKPAITEAKTSSKKGSAITSISKERQAIIQVAVLSVLFLLTRSAPIVKNVAEYIEPRLRRKQRYMYFSAFYRIIYKTMDIINASVNFLVYYICNSKFKEACFQKTIYNEEY